MEGRSNAALFDFDMNGNLPDTDEGTVMVAAVKSGSRRFGAEVKHIDRLPVQQDEFGRRRVDAARLRRS
jgi:hypothetical protein